MDSITPEISVEPLFAVNRRDGNPPSQFPANLFDSLFVLRRASICANTLPVQVYRLDMSC